MAILKQSELPAEELPLQEFRDHLCLGTGFGDTALQDPVLESFLRAAMATVEAQTAKVLIERTMTLTLMAWSRREEHVFPIAPVAAVQSVAFLLDGGGTDLVPSSMWWLRKDDALPAIVARSAPLPTPPLGSEIEIRFVAGFGPWAVVPNDLRQAVMMLAGHYYENRAATQLNAGCMPFGVTALLEPYRLRRIGFGSAV